AGNKSLSDTEHSWSLDKTPPGVPPVSGAPAGTVATAAASLTFTGSEVGSTFECSTNDGSWIACQSPFSLSDLPEGANTFAVRQVDRSGNRGLPSTTAWRVKSFTSPPFIISGPLPLTQIRDSSISFEGEAGGTFECSLNSSGFAPCTSPRTFAALTDGSYALRIRQIDSLGTASIVSSVSWQVDATPPNQPGTTSTPPAATAVPSQSIPFTGEADGTFACRLNSGDWGSCSSPFLTGPLEDGQQRFEVRQTDPAGNTGASRLVEWLLKTTKPRPPEIQGTPSGTFRLKAVTMTMVAESGTTIECSVNGAAWAPCGSPMSLAGLPEGSNRVEVQAVDAAGNRSNTVAVVWTVDTVAPKLKGKVRGLKSKVATVIRSTFDASSGRPAKLEYSTSKKKPSNTATPAGARMLGWAPSLTVRSRSKVTWVRVVDQVGNASSWYPVQ
ncbi:MAG: hypothetical protein WEB05_00775, partial [Solirubrobacterales bacterium]